MVLVEGGAAGVAPVGKAHQLPHIRLEPALAGQSWLHLHFPFLCAAQEEDVEGDGWEGGDNIISLLLVLTALVYF